MTPEQKQIIREEQREVRIIERQWQDFINRMREKGAIVEEGTTNA